MEKNNVKRCVQECVKTCDKSKKSKVTAFPSKSPKPKSKISGVGLPPRRKAKRPASKSRSKPKIKKSQESIKSPAVKKDRKVKALKPIASDMKKKKPKRQASRSLSKQRTKKSRESLEPSRSLSKQRTKKSRESLKSKKDKRDKVSVSRGSCQQFRPRKPDKKEASQSLSKPKIKKSKTRRSRESSQRKKAKGDKKRSFSALRKQKPDPDIESEETIYAPPSKMQPTRSISRERKRGRKIKRSRKQSPMIKKRKPSSGSVSSIKRSREQSPMPKKIKTSSGKVCRLVCRTVSKGPRKRSSSSRKMKRKDSKKSWMPCSWISRACSRTFSSRKSDKTEEKDSSKAESRSSVCSWLFGPPKKNKSTPDIQSSSRISVSGKTCKTPTGVVKKSRPARQPSYRHLRPPIDFAIADCVKACQKLGNRFKESGLPQLGDSIVQFGQKIGISGEAITDVAVDALVPIDQYENTAGAVIPTALQMSGELLRTAVPYAEDSLFFNWMTKDKGKEKTHYEEFDPQEFYMGPGNPGPVEMVKWNLFGCPPKKK